MELTTENTSSDANGKEQYKAFDIQKKTQEAEIAQLNLDNLPEFVWIPDFISLAGSVVYNTIRKPNDLDVIVRSDESNSKFTIELDKSLRLKIDRILLDRVGSPSDNWSTVDWIGNTYGPNWKYLSLYDLVLRPKKPEIHKLDEPEFEAEFYKSAEDSKQIIDDKLKHPERHKTALLSDLRYMGNTGFPLLQSRKPWGTWSKLGLLQYFAKIVDALRSIDIELVAPLIGDDKYKTSYWECYRQARKYLKKPEIIAIEKPIAKDLKFSITKEDERIVTSVVYPVDEEDSQGDFTDAIEIRKAAIGFMENSKRIKVYHEGQSIAVNIIETYLSPVDWTMTDTHGNTQFIKKGSWVMSLRILDDYRWKQIKDGTLTGFSIGGTAQV